MAQPRRSSAPLMVVLAVVVASGVLATCNEVPVASLEKSFSVLVDQSSGTGEAIKIDFLWMVDNSTSMCQEQTALAQSFQSFTDVFAQDFKLDLDPRVAVVTADMHCTEQQLAGSSSDVIASLGKFNDRPATGYPPSCQEVVPYQCTTDDDCEGLDCSELGACGDPVAGEWTCETEKFAQCVVNPNGSVNTGCKRSCESDADCVQVFGDPRFECRNVSGQIGCMLPPEISICPDSDSDGTPDVLPAVLDGSNLSLFECLATVGANQNNCYKYEQGLASALAALDKDGPNAAEIACSADQEDAGECLSFLRDDAYLVIIFVSDEDDCSAAEPIPEADHDVCALQKTQDDGVQLIPVWHYVNSFKSLKADPSRVIVAAISGDVIVPTDGPATHPDPSVFETGAETDFGKQALLDELGYCDLPADPTDAEVEAYQDCVRGWFFASKGNDYVCHNESYICRSAAGISDFGSRYHELSERFGANGIFVNICSEAGIEPALVEIAQKIVTIVKKVCLPKPVLDEDSLVVEKTLVDPDSGEAVLDPSTGEPQRVVMEDTDYVLQSNGGDDCRVDGQVLPAIVFSTPPTGEEKVFVTYQGDPL